MEKKKMMATGVTLAILGAAGYGAWTMYKKQNPYAANNLKRSINKVSKNVEKSMEDMM